MRWWPDGLGPRWRLKPRLGDLGSIRIGKVSCGLWVPSCAKLRLGASHWLVRQVYRPFEASKCSGFRQLKLVKVHFWPESLTIFWGWKDQAASFKLSLRPTFWGNSSNSLDVTALSTSQSSQTMIIGHSTAQGAPRCWRPTVRTLWGHEDFLKKGVIRFLSDSAGRSQWLSLAVTGCHWLSLATCGLVVRYFQVIGSGVTRLDRSPFHCEAKWKWCILPGMMPSTYSCVIQFRDDASKPTSHGSSSGWGAKVESDLKKL